MMKLSVITIRHVQFSLHMVNKNDPVSPPGLCIIQNCLSTCIRQDACIKPRAHTYHYPLHIIMYCEEHNYINYNNYAVSTVLVPAPNTPTLN